MKYLEDALYEYGMSDAYPFHMPGHKRKHFDTELEEKKEIMKRFSKIYKMDITEIDGFDNLHHPQGIIEELMQEMSTFYHTKKTYLLVNGSTAGILSSISACTNSGDEILAARNCHKSVWNACFLRNLDVSYIVPQVIEESGIYGGICAEDVDKLLKQNPLTKAVIIVSPTYEGIVSDIEEIARITHSYGKLLIVDEAHGAHFPFASKSSQFPKSALSCGADIVIQSLHKTLPSMTQTAIMHINSDRVSVSEVERYLSIYQSSSPSYILMASMSLCFHYMKKEGLAKMKEYERKLIFLREKIQQLKFLSILGKNLIGKYSVFDYDISKLVFVTVGTGWTGYELAGQLREEFYLEMEMSSVEYTVAMTSVMDDDSGYDRLSKALKTIDDNGVRREVIKNLFPVGEYLKHLPAQKMSSVKAASLKGRYKKFESCLGNVTKETLYVYPPGVAFLIAGEIIDETVLFQVKWYQENGFEIFGLSKNGYFLVVDE